jgi:GAF domain-containing protein
MRNLSSRVSLIPDGTIYETMNTLPGPSAVYPSAALMMDVSLALIQGTSLPEMLCRCTEALVQHLDGAFARIWLVNAEQNTLDLQASSGLYTHLDGPHSRVPIGQFKIGLIAQERKPHLSNAVLEDPRISDLTWARREGMVAFAGYPLIVEDRLVGVMAMFARHTLPPAVLEGMASVANAIAVGTERKLAEEALVEKTREMETLQRIGEMMLVELDQHKLVQIVTDEATALCGAQFGSFFYNVVDTQGESYLLYTISGVPREKFARFPMPRKTAVFAPSFDGEGPVRSDDITRDPRYGHNAPYYGMPSGHLPVRSYLAVPVTSRSGEVIGGLFFGHAEPARFEARHERMLMGIATQTAIAMDNARLFEAAQTELQQRRKAEAQLRERHTEIKALNARLKRAMVETHHRVKNNLQLVTALLEMQSPAENDTMSIHEVRRLNQHIQALGVIHDILTEEAKEDGEANDLSTQRVLGRLIPVLQTTLGERRLLATIEDLLLTSKQVTSVAIIVNELISNAGKYGRGDVELTLQEGDDRVHLEVCDDGEGFSEAFDPSAADSTGVELIENITHYDLRGETSYQNRPEGGARVAITFPRASEPPPPT